MMMTMMMSRKGVLKTLQSLEKAKKEIAHPVIEIALMMMITFYAGVPELVVLVVL